VLKNCVISYFGAANRLDDCILSGCFLTFLIVTLCNIPFFILHKFINDEPLLKHEGLVWIEQLIVGSGTKVMVII
jgi:hypothetical protein